MSFTYHPVTPDRWNDFEALFGAKGACAGCWCMFFRQSRKEFDANRGESNRLAMKAIVESGKVPGLLAYDGERPVGHRRRGVTVGLLEAAAGYVREQGGQILEGYPIAEREEYPDTFAYVGLPSAFRKAGFVEVARPSGSRIIVRRAL